MISTRFLGFSGPFAGALVFSVVACTSTGPDDLPRGDAGVVADSGAGTTSTGGNLADAADAGGTLADAADAMDASDELDGDAGTITPGPTGELGPWAPTAGSPLSKSNCVGTAPNLYCAEQTCVASSGRAYCMGGASTSTYYSELSSGGAGAWIATTDYPEAIAEASCVVSSDTLYCVGGRVTGADGGQNATADVYYAPLSSSGIGTWTAYTPYPYDVLEPQCMTDSGMIYCVSASVDPPYTLQAYYATISSTGIGTWSPTTVPPTHTEGCAAIDGYAYCFGGASCCPDGPGSDCTSPSYFAPLTASGIGAWQTTTQLPTAVSANYATADSTIYYLSIPVFFASVSAGGIGPWQTTTNYPSSFSPAACFSSGGYLYCANAAQESSYFAQVGVSNPNALQLENPPPFPRASYLAPAASSGGAASVNGVGAPLFQNNIDNAVVFDCASEASTDAGCTTTVVSPGYTQYNYDLTIWYPCTSATPSGTNCCFLPAVGYSTPFDSWCISVGSNSFIIADGITLEPSSTSCSGGPAGL